MFRHVAAPAQVRSWHKAPVDRPPPWVASRQHAPKSGEYDENVERMPFQATEVYDMWQAMAPLEKAAAEERAAEGRRRGGLIRQDSLRQNLPEAESGQKGRVRDKTGAFAGLSGFTVDKVHQVCEAARAEPAGVNGFNFCSGSTKSRACSFGAVRCCSGNNVIESHRRNGADGHCPG